jgi:hypothetical protein
MTASLNNLEWLAIVDETGHLPEQLQGQVGVYAIFDQERVLQYVGFSRDVYLGLKQHLVRQPHLCHWLKVQTVERPSRTALEAIRDAWIAENGATPVGNGAEEASWNQPINVKLRMTADEQKKFDAAADAMAQIKTLKQVARRVEAEILESLKQRGVQADIRFNPKLKEEGLLDLK